MSTAPRRQAIARRWPASAVRTLQESSPIRDGEETRRRAAHAGEGKMWIHTAGVTRSRADFALCFRTKQELFLESMAEAAGSVMNRLGGNVVYISLMNNLSVDCDCDSHPAAPVLDDIGILASSDPVALDKACVDLVYAADRSKSAPLRGRIESRKGMHTLEHAAALGLGSLTYDLIRIDA